MTIKEDKPSALYIHVPFCRSICYYCDFCHVIYNEELVNDWLAALKHEIESLVLNKHLKTIYIGGGTPTSLNYTQLEILLSTISAYSKYVEEYTVEINPESFDIEKGSLLKYYGVNRVSIGFQTSDEKLLIFMNRHHSFEVVKKCISICEEVGITNYSLDIMYSLPNQKLDSLIKSVDDAISLHPKHLSLYSLTIEEDTVFGKKGVTSLDSDIEADMYEWLCKYLPTKGYNQYEISNFCLDGYQSKHNLVYWHYDDFYGLSAGASGKENHIRYDKSSNVYEYIKNPLKRYEINLTKEDEMFEMVMMSLRLKEGISKQSFYDRFIVNINEVFPMIDEMIKTNKLVDTGTHIKCSDSSFHLLNELLVELLPE